jgi:hypothetical protein
MASRYAKMTQTIIFIIFAVVLSIILLSYFNINMSSNEPSKLNRFAVYEGLTNNNREGKKTENLENKNRANLLIP